MPITADSLAEIAAIAKDPLGSGHLRENPLPIARWLIESSLASGNQDSSFANAHELGLHSIMLHDFGQGGKIRMFYAEGGRHKLADLTDVEDDLRCRLHDHRFDVAIVPVLGDVLQIHSAETPDGSGPVRRTKYRFISALLNGSGQFGFERLGDKTMVADDDELLVPGDVSFLTSDGLHSINTTPECSTSDVAWLVIEGAARKPDSILYSAIPDLPVQETASGLYIPMSRNTAHGLTRHILDAMKQQ